MPEATISDEVLGTLTWDEQYQWYEGHREIAPGHTIELRISAEKGVPDAWVARARQVYQSVQEHEVAFREAAADALLSLHNNAWNDETPIDRKTFAGRMSWQGLSIYTGGGVQLNYDDGDLFWGHTIAVTLGEDNTVQDVNIEG